MADIAKSEDIVSASPVDEKKTEDMEKHEKTPGVKDPKEASEVKEPEAKAPDLEEPAKTPELATPAEDLKAPVEETQDAQTPPPATKAPESKETEAAPEADTKASKPKISDVKTSLTGPVIEAIEHVVVEAGTAAIKEITTKNGDDLKTIENGLSKEAAAQAKEGLPSLPKIREAIVESAKTINEEVAEGAEIVIKDVEAHPEFLLEGAVAVGVGIASLVQPELIVGSVALVGKMAADRAKDTANKIALEASTHIVKELGKDLTKDLAKGEKLEATTKKTNVVENTTVMDGDTGKITNNETKTSFEETKLAIIATPVETAETTDPTKKEVTAENGKKGPSVVVSAGAKNVSVKIDEDGTITIGTDKKEAEKEAEAASLVSTEEVDEKAHEVLLEKAAEEPTEDPVETPIKTETEKVVEEVPAKSEEVSEKKETEEVSKGADAESRIAEVTPSVFIEESTKDVSKEMASSQPSRDGAFEATITQSAIHIHKSLAQIHEKLDALKSPAAEKGTEIALVDTHTHESLAQIQKQLTELVETESKSKEVVAPAKEDETPKITPEDLEKIHAKLDGLIASNAEANDAVVNSIKKASPTVSPEDLDKIHLKLDGLITSNAEAKNAVVNSIKKASPTVSPEDLDKIHLKLDGLITSNAKAAESTKTVPVPTVTLEDLKNIHAKLDKMQEALSIKPAEEDKFAPVHEKMDTIHNAILASVKTTEVPAATEPKPESLLPETLEQFHQKFEAMQASIDKLTEALLRKLSPPPVQYPAALLTPETSTSKESPKVEDIKDDIAKLVAEVAEATSPNAVAEVAKTSPPFESTELTTEPTTETLEPTDEVLPIKSTDSKTKHERKRSSFFGGIFG